MEEDINFLERRIKLNSQMYLEFGRLLSLDEETTTAIKNLINKYKEQEKHIEALDSVVVEHIEKSKEQEKIIELMHEDMKLEGYLKMSKEELYEYYRKRIKIESKG